MDSLLVRERTLCDRKICLAMICDGVGSLADGAFASAGVVRMLGEWFDTVADVTRIGLRMRDEMMKIDREISVQASDMDLRTGTTVSAILIDGENYYVVHTGDSRIYSVGPTGFERLTYDQVNNGRLTSCLGRRNNATFLYNEGRCGGRRFLLCSDGLYKRTEENILEEELLSVDRKSCKKTVQRLARYAVDCGETDNISIVIVICES